MRRGLSGGVVCLVALAAAGVSGCGKDDGKSAPAADEVGPAILEALSEKADYSGGFECDEDFEQATVEDIKSGGLASFKCELKVTKQDGGGESSRTSNWQFIIKRNGCFDGSEDFQTVDLTGLAEQYGGFSDVPAELQGCAQL